MIEHDGSGYDMNTPDGAPNYAARAPVTRRFYQTHGDDYDFLVVFTNFPFDTGAAQAFYSLVRNDVRGIGRPLGDNGALFGSAGRLKGYVDMADMDRWRRPGGDYSLRPGDPGFQTTLNVLAHELGHQWLAEARYLDAAGQVSSDLVGAGAHWSYLLDSDASVMYGSDWTPRGDGRYVASRADAAYSALDLYLMGLLEASRLPPFSLLRNPAVDPNQAPVLDAEVDAEPEAVTVEQLVAAMGPRIPDHRASPKEFRLGFVFLTRPGTEPDAGDLAAVETVRQYFAAHFFALTRGVAVADTSLAETAVEPSAPAPDLDRALAWLLAQQAPQGSWEDAAATAVRDTAAVLDTLVTIGRTDAPYQQGRSWLGAADPWPVDFAARRAGVLAPEATAAARTLLLQRLLAAQGADGGFGFLAGFESDALDTALALRALSRLAQPVGSVVKNALVSLGAQRLSTGGWPLVGGGDTSAVVTAEVLLALQDWAGVPEADALLAPALAALVARQNPDGGFGESPSTPHGTALALQALLRAGAPPDIVDGAVGWLQARQSSDGSWDSRRYETALVLAVLRGGVAANLIVPADGLAFEPDSPVKEGSTVRVRARVRNAGRRPSAPTLARVYDGAPGTGAPVADAAVAALEAGEEASVEFDLPTAGRAGSRTFYVVADPDGLVPEAREDDNTASRALTIDGLLPDLAVGSGDLEVVPHPPEEGETVAVSVRVANRGEKRSPASVVRLVRGDPRQGGVLLGEAPLPALEVGQAAVVALPWNTAGQAGEHTLRAVADAAASVFERDETNNETALAVSVTGPQPPGPDLQVAQVTLQPPVLQTVPATIAVTVLVRNLGRDPAASSLALRVDGAPAGELPLSLGPRSSTTATFSLDVATPGDRSLVAVADPFGTLEEIDESNNEAAVVLVDPRNTVDLEIRAEEVTAPAELVVGQGLVVTALVHNRGTAPVAGVPIVLRREDEPGELARATVTLPPGASGAVTMAWTATFAAEAVPFLVIADPFGLLAEVSEENNVAGFTVRIAPSALTNLRVSGADVHFDPDPPLEGQPATVSATVWNTSPVEAGPFTVRFHRGEPAQGGSAIGETALGGLAAESSTTAAVGWSPVDARGAQGVFVVVDALEQVAEHSEDDNQAFRAFSVLALPDLALTVGQVALDPRYPRAGEVVTARATVRNLGQQGSPATVLRAFSGEPGGGGEIASAPLPPLAPGGSAVVELSWTPDAPPGERTVSLLADADDAVREVDEGNNLARLRILVQDADLFLTETHFSPDGDGVRDHTTLGYRATGPVTVTVSNRLGHGVRTLATDAPASGSLSWDGTDDRGMLLPDGMYTLTLEGEEGAVLGRIRAFLDTNRESIHDAAGTGRLAIHNLTCGLPKELSGTAFMPGEDEILLIVNRPSAHQPFPLGLVRVGLDGQYTFVAKDPWYHDTTFASSGPVSPDGREVLVLKGWTLYAVDLLTGTRRALADGVFRDATWSPDGRWIATDAQVLARDGSVASQLPGLAFSSGAWSPDSRWLAIGTFLVRPDGSESRTIPGLPVHISQVRETVWRGDGRIVARISGCTECGGFTVADVETFETALVIDPEADTVRELTWLRHESEDVTSRSPIGWSADGSRLLYVFRGREWNTVSDVAYEDGSSPVQLLPHRVALSPRGSAAWYVEETGPGTGCLGTFDRFAAFSLQNLTVAMLPSRLPANNGILVTATVSDRHLDHYQLEYAVSSDPDTWRPIGPASEVPVLDDVVTVWVPPAPDTYLLRLRAEDRAGNVRARTSVVSWDRVPVLANITQTEFLVSPNGDGAKDAVIFHYLVLAPTRAEVRIVGPRSALAGGGPPPLVRRFSLDHPALGPASFEWDGRNEEGAVVPDGRYTVLIDDIPFRVDVDATPPDIAWSYENLRIEDGRLVADRLARIVDPGLAEWDVPGWFGGNEPIYAPVRDADGEIVYADGVPKMLVVAGVPASRRERVPAGSPPPVHNEVYGLATDPSAVLAAEDFAGNRSVLAILPVEERLVLVSAGAYDGPLEDDEVHRLQPRSAFTLAETIRDTPEDGEAVRFLFQPREGGAWSEGPAFALNREVTWLADFEVMGLHPGREYRGRFLTRARGRDFASQEFLFRPCTEALSLALDLVPGSASATTARWQLALSADVPERLVSATLTVTGTGGLAGYRAVSAFDMQADNLVLTPLPSCAHDPPSALQFEVKVTGESGRTYEHDDRCRILQRLSGLCSSLELAQTFGYCAGSPDAISLTVEATSADTDATARVERGPSEAPRTLAEFAVPFRLGLPVVHELAEDVSGVADGALEIRATLGDAERPDLVTTALAAIVDRTPPAAEFLAPSEGGQLCVTSDPATGLDLASLFVEVADGGPRAEFASAEIEHLGGPRQGERSPLDTACVAPDPDRPVSYPPLCGNGGLETVFPLVRTGSSVHLGWNVSGLPDGDYAVRATFCDRAGNRTTASRRLSFVRQPPRLELLSLSPFFSPNGDDAADDMTVKLRITQPVKLRIEVAGVRRLLDEVTLPAGEHSFTWDGTHADGTVAPDGAYALVFHGTDGCGRETTFSAQVVLDNTPPTAVIAAPAPGQTVGVAAEVRGTADDAHFDVYEVGVGSGTDPVQWTAVGAAPAFSGPAGPTDPPSLLARWDTPATPGVYTLRLVARDLASNRTETRVTVEVRPRVYLGRLSAAPDVFSPNGDGRRESTSIEYELLAGGRVSLEVTTAGLMPVRTLEAGIERPPGVHAFVWEGTAQDGAPAADGEYRVRIRVEDPAGTAAPQEEAIPVVVDRLAPAIAVDSPLPDGFATRDQSVRGAIADARLSQYVVTAFPAAAADPVELRRGTVSPMDRTLAPLAPLTDGRYTLFVRAEDTAENRATLDVPFVLDATPPTVTIGQPVAGAVLDSLGTPIAVTGTASDEHLWRYTLGFGPGADPAYFTDVASGSTGGVGLPLASWALSGLADGPYTLRLDAVDRAGLRGETRRTVVVDGTPPLARIDTPGEGAYVNTGDVTGAAADANLEAWRLEFAAGPAATASLWSPVGQGSGSVPGGPLATWDPMPSDGVYALRLTVRDGAGHETAAAHTVTVDQTPPATPAGLAAVVERTNDTAALVRLGWNASPEPDLAGYRLYRDDQPLTAALLAAPSYEDGGRPEGRSRYAVEAVDRAGNVSPRAGVSAVVDLTPPIADVLSPRAGAAVSGSVEVRGTAYSADDFREYRLYVGTSTDPSALTLLRRSTVPVSAGVLGAWTAAGSGAHVLVIEAEDLSGNQARATAPVVVDNEPPTPPVLTSVANGPDPSTLTATWDASPSPDVAGYLVYRNGRVANAPGLVLDHPRGFLLPPPSYADASLPDGEHCYRVVAMDAADNVSPPSNEVCRALDNRAPSARILQPPDGTRFDYPLRLVADSPDLDVASVQFQLRGEGDGAWLDLGGPHSAPPYETTLDTAPLAPGVYALRAVATDRGGRSDPDAASIAVTYGDATPPRPPEGLAARADGAEVALSWSAAEEADVAGYHVFRDGERITDDAVPSPSFVDAGRDAGSYRYEVTATDGAGNQSAPSAPVYALIHAVALDAPPFPVTTAARADLAGSGAPAGSTVHVLHEDVVVGEAASAAGTFHVSGVALGPGPNLLRARATDAEGNRSLPSPEVVLIANTPPPAVTSLTATLEGYDVHLAWAAVADPELQGYLVERGETTLTGPSLQTVASSIDASHLWFDPAIGDYREPAHAFDADPATAWIAPPGAAAPEWTVTFPDPVLVDRVTLRFGTVAAGVVVGAPVASYRVEALWEGRFVPVVIAANNASSAVTHVLPSAFATQELRIVLAGAQGQPGLAEVEVSKIDVVPAGTAERRDTAPDGVFAYRVSALDRYGARGPAATAELAVGDVVPPSAPTGLVAVAEGSDVVLAWNANPEADVLHYAVVRDEARIATTPNAGHRDGARLNGTYAYRVIAVDGAGNESPPSGPASVTVDVSPPVAPTLYGTVGPLGEVVLTWDHPGAADYAVFRGLTPGGPHAPLAQTGGLRSHGDATARLGIAHYYVVRAMDAGQNASGISNEVALTPVRTAPVVPPAILFPTDAAHPMALEAARTPVQGRAPPDSLVVLDVNGALARITETRAAWTERDAIVMAGGSRFVASRNGAAVAYGTGDVHRGPLHVLDVASGVARQIQHAGYTFLSGPVLSADGRRLAYAATDDTRSPWSVDLFVLDLADGTVTPVEDGPASPRQAAWSPEGTRLAYVAVSHTWPFAAALVVRDLSAGTERVLGSAEALDDRYAPEWSPDGTRVAFTGLGLQVAIVDADSRDEVLVAPGWDPTWSPDGRHLAYVTSFGFSQKVVVRDLESGLSRELSDGQRMVLSPAFDRTGGLMSHLELWLPPVGDVRAELVVQELATGRRIAIEPRPGDDDILSVRPVTWLDDGRLAVNYDSRARLGLFEAEAGFFAFPEVSLQAEENTLVARAVDPASGLESADSEPVHVTVPESLFADLSVSAAEVTAHPAALIEGGPSSLSAIVRNVGAAVATDVRVLFTVFDPSGRSVLEQEATLTEVAPQSGVTLSVAWTPAAAGGHRVRVRADPPGFVDERREDNNEAIRDVEVAAAEGVVARIASDRSLYEARAPARLEVVIANAGAAAEGHARTSVEDASGREVAVVDVRAVALAYGGEQRFTLSWNTGATYAGDYLFRVRVEGSDAVLATAAQPFRIAPEVAVAARLVADRSVVGEGAPASFSGRVENLGTNAALGDLRAWFRIVPDGTPVPILEQEHVLPLLLPAGLWEGGFAWPAAGAGGSYRATLTVVLAGQTLATAEAPFEVSPGAASFAGTLTLQPPDALAGAAVEAWLAVTNRGASPVAALPAAVEVRQGTDAALVERQTLTLDLMPGETRTAAVWLSVPSPGTYPVVLLASDPATAIARATLRVHGPITAPAVDAPANGARVATPHPELRVNNALSPEGAPLAYEFQLFADPALTVVLPGAPDLPETASVTGWRVPSKLAEDATYWWRARATDGFSSSAWTPVSSFVVDERNEPPLAPVSDRPEPGARVGSREPTLVVRNALDPELDALAYEFRLATDPDLTTIVVSASDVAQGPALTEWRVPSPLEENATYYWSARAWDGASHSPWSAPASFTVDTLDESPSAPVPLRPIGDARVLLLVPELVVQNAVDPEGAAPTYRFEVDRVLSFDSPALQASGDVAESPDQTRWTPPSELLDNATHYWRASASDGRTSSPWADARFFVNLANDAPGAPVPLDPADLQVVTTATPSLRVRNAQDLDGDDLIYAFEVADASGGVVASESGVEEGAVETTWTVPAALVENGLFTWRARARDAELDGPWSPASRLRVNAVYEPPTEPTLAAPPEGAVVETSRVTLTVSNATSPDGAALTYAFELYREDTDGGPTLVGSVSGLDEGMATTSWSPPDDLADGLYGWRARARDAVQAGPWMASAHFGVRTDVPPAPPTGVAAVPGDGEVTLTWNPNVEPDVVAYRLYRGEVSGGPYAPVASVSGSGAVDRGLANGITVYYVVTAVDGHFESAYSREAAATPRAQQLVAETRLLPDQVAGECLVVPESDDGRDGAGDAGERCPPWIYATAELPPGEDPRSIEASTVRLAGAVPADPGYDRIVDLDSDGIPERKLRFRFTQLAPHLRIGVNALSLTGSAGGAEFHGTGTLAVLDLVVDLWFTPRTFNRRSKGQEVQARLVFRSGMPASAVDTTGLRLNGSVPITRVVSSQGARLIVKFDRAAVAEVLPAGDQVAVWVTGAVAGVPFVARDVIRVIE